MAPKKPNTAAAAKAKPVKGAHSKVDKAWTYKKYQNGLLNLKAPARYMSITDLPKSKTNSVTSPLLALPAEIRNSMFRYAIGGYEIYIKAINDTYHRDAVTGRMIYEKNRMFTTILPKGEQYQIASADDVLPSISLPRVCRQLYTETALLSYMLNHFKFGGSLSRTAGNRHAGFYHNPLDFWLNQRAPAQIKVISSIGAPHDYLRKYLYGGRPAFSTILPGLKLVDLQAGQVYLGDVGPERFRHSSIVNKDLESGIGMLWSTTTGPTV